MHSKDKYYRCKCGKTLVRSSAGRGLGSAANSPQQEDMGTEREVKYERNSLLPNHIPRKSLGSMPENKLKE